MNQALIPLLFRYFSYLPLQVSDHDFIVSQCASFQLGQLLCTSQHCIQPHVKSNLHCYAVQVHLFREQIQKLKILWEENMRRKASSLLRTKLAFLASYNCFNRNKDLLMQ